MASVRLIPRLDIKGPNLIKGIHLEGLRVIGDPNEHALRYYQAGADEILYLDVVASLYGRQHLLDIIQNATKNVFIPITAGGGVRTLQDVQHLLDAGADKVAVNTAATLKPEFISDIARRYGSQCMVLSIEAIRQAPGKWQAFCDNGREATGLDVVQWAKRGVELGAGEILLTSVDMEGCRKGFDIDLVRAVVDAVRIPVIASGGMGSIQDFVTLVQDTGVEAVSMADILHYNRVGLDEIRSHGIKADIPLRRI